MEPEMSVYDRTYWTDVYAKQWAHRYWPERYQEKAAEIIEKANEQTVIKYKSSLFTLVRNIVIQLWESNNQGREEK